MGIDARILVRIKQAQRPTDEQLARWSWDLCRSVGARHFFIKDGIPAAAYETAIKAWNEKFNAHPLAPYWRGNPELHKQILTDIGEAPNELRRAIELSPDYSDEGNIGDGRAYFQDGETLYAAEGEWFLRVSLWTRYYGIGYERGDLMTILATAAWFDTNLPGSDVWYGGDSSGVEAEPFTPAKRAELLKHLMSQSGREYFNHGRNGSYPTPAPCSLCIPGEPRFNRHGWGGNYVAVNCAGCGKSFSSRDGGKTWTVEKDE